MGSTEPANYWGYYTTEAKEAVDIEIAMYQSTRPPVNCFIRS
jgi:hypothetical protein